MRNRFLIVGMALMSCVIASAQTKSAIPQRKSPAPAPTQAAAPRAPATTAVLAATQRALLDQYCVTCHNDKTKRANLTLEKLDLATVGDNPQLWEKVVRKLRAGVMPPPGMRRPELTAYTGLTEWLEGQIDRKAKVNPGTIVLHRLNRAE